MGRLNWRRKHGLDKNRPGKERSNTVSQFEYLSIAISMVFAISVSRQVAAIPYVFSKSRWDWLYAGYFLAILLMQWQFWWRMWSFQSIEVWQFHGFVLMMTGTFAYYLATFTLIPDKPENCRSWREHFEYRFRWIIGSIGFIWFVGGVISWILLDFNPPPPFYITVLLCVFGASIQNRILHWLVLVWLILLLGLITVNLQAGVI